MIGVIDYGVGNLYSLISSFQHIGADIQIMKNPEDIRKADKLVLPGVGAFKDAADKLKQSGMQDALLEETKNGKDLLGICLGMQMLFEESLEFGCHKGLGLLKGRVVPMKGRIDSKLKIPHIGWNALHITGNNTLLRNIKEGDHVYFVHSFFADECRESLIAATEYGIELTAAVQKSNVMGCQFHPEKSGEVGLNILRAFCEGGNL